MTDFRPLSGFAVVNLAINLPGPAAAARLSELGASVTKVEPPEGDPTEAASKELYDRLAEGHTILRLNLKEPAGRERLAALLERCDLLLTSSRPSALARLGLAWSDVESRHPRLVQVAIVGHAAPLQELAGHDLTYVGRHGLLAPPDLPRTLVADLGGAELRQACRRRRTWKVDREVHDREAGERSEIRHRGPSFQNQRLEDGRRLSCQSRA